MLSVTRLLPLGLAVLGVLPAFAGSAGASTIETVFQPGPGAVTRTIDHSDWDKMLKSYVVPAEDGLNRIDYRRFKAESHAPLKAYVRRLEATDVTKLGRAEQFAFWANIYNAKTLDVVLEHYPVKSIRDINLGGGLFAVFTGGPWKAKIMKVNGHDLSLDDVEHVIMRGLFKDYRVHFAVNCASVGCPNVSRDAFTGEGLDAHLARNGREFINSSRGAKIVNGGLQLSKIFSWFAQDFGGTDQTVISHVRKYAEPDLAARLANVTRIADYYYDWSLNDVAR